MGEENNFEFWGLSLSLKPPITHLNHKPICKREPPFSTDEQSPKMQRPNKNVMMKPMIRMGLGLKPSAKIIDLEEIEITPKDGSPNSTLSSASAKRLGGGGFSTEKEMMISDEDEGGNGGGSCGGERKKLRLTKEQIMVLEQAFKEHTTLNTKQKLALAKQVSLRPRQVEVWFQNRRARTKLKQTEVDCEHLKRICENLTEENKKLQKEVQELRTLNKLSPEQSLMHANHPSTTLSTCPSCKHVSFISSSASAPPPAGETGRYPMGVYHRPIPLNVKKLSFTINNNRVFESHKLM